MSACGLCARELGAAGVRTPLTVLCRFCAGASVRVRTSAAERVGPPKVRTFYVSSFQQRARVSATASEYVVKRFGRRMTCTCPDFVHRAQVENVACKHVRLIRLLARAAGGVDHVPAGVTLRLRLDGERQR